MPVHIGAAILNVVRSGFLTTSGLALLATGVYVTYKDYTRYPRMVDGFATGNITQPFVRDTSHLAHFSRPHIEAKVRDILRADFTGHYYLIKGEVGTGKSRILLGEVRKQCETQGKLKEGAPIYVLASQGESFPDALAQAVKFQFDEHINFKYFLDFLFRVHSMPGRDEHHKLSRVLNAIERAAIMYVKEYDRPVVLVVDGAHWITSHIPGAMDHLQEKAKLWSDSNIAKVIFVTNEEATQELLQRSYSNWSRAAAPLFIDDMDEMETASFLSADLLIKSPPLPDANQIFLDPVKAKKIYQTVGGRIHYLLEYKRDMANNIDIEDTSARLIQKEREKFLHIKEKHEMVSAIKVLAKDKRGFISTAEFTRLCSHDDLETLCSKHIVKLRRHDMAIVVEFESVLTATLVGTYFVNK